MYVASYPADGNTSEKHVVYRISDLTNNPQPEKLVTVPGQYDGIAFASDGASLYVTNWTPAGISRINLRNGDLLPVGLSLRKAYPVRLISQFQTGKFIFLTCQPVVSL